MSEQTDAGLRVGVTGHRPNRLVGTDIAELRGSIREVLHAIASVASNEPLTIISPIAEGADRLVALEGLAAGYPLICPLPFRRTEYERDFATVASQAEFRAILQRAQRVIELPGTRGTPHERDVAYAAVGDFLVSSSDLLLAIWDGGMARGNGGTADVVAAALEARLPVIWVGTQKPHATQIVTWDGTTMHEGGTLADLAQLLRDHAAT